jgi:hypothetical protein
VVEITDEIEIALLEGVKFIFGHFSYAAIEPLAKDVQVFTLLRHPVSRVRSVYRFWRTQSPEQQQSSAARFAVHLAHQLNFREFLECDHPLITSATRNEMCKALAGDVATTDQRDEFLALTELASARLSAMPFGIVEQLEQSLRLLSRQLRLNLEDMLHKNVTPDNATVVERAPTVLEETLARNAADLILFRSATEILNNRLLNLHIAQLYNDIGESALTPMRPEEDGSFVWDAVMPIRGTNWQERETLAEGATYRWTSVPESMVLLPNPFDGQIFTIRVFVLFFNDHGLLQHAGPLHGRKSLQFKLDTHAIEAVQIEAHDDAAEYFFTVSPSKKGRRWLSLSICSNYGVRPSLYGSPDTRPLASAVTSITLSPKIN